MAVSLYYPPILQTFIPSFTEGVIQIPYINPDFNGAIKREDGVYIECTFTSQNTNILLFKSSILVEGVQGGAAAALRVNIDENLEIENGEYLKVQLRFVTIDAANTIEALSEFSSVGLVKKIQLPTVSNINSEATKVTYMNPSLDYYTTISFGSNDKEYLSEYRVGLYTRKNGALTLIEDSEWQKSSVYSSTNSIAYHFDSELQDETTYAVYLSYITSSGFSRKNIPVYFLTTDFSSNERLDCEIIIEPNSEKGAIRIRLDKVPENIEGKHILFKRTSSRSNFTKWEDVCFLRYSVSESLLPILSLKDGVAEISPQTLYYNVEGGYYGLYLDNYISARLLAGWYDNTVESGVWYKYGIQIVSQDENGAYKRGQMLKSEKPVMIIYDSIFINSQNKQLKIKYDAKVDGYKINTIETKSDTIGSQYPVILKNGDVRYRQMEISGTISHLVNEDDYYFITNEELYGNDSVRLYSQYNLENRITRYNDYIGEREFREKVIDFLYDDNVKLIRTLTEKPIIAKFMNVNLSPKQELNNYVYSFSATAYEVDDYNLENIYKYNISSLDFRTIEDSIYLEG